MKRIAICCDGTWQDRRRTFPTNVAKIDMALKRASDQPGEPQIVEYSPGIGSGSEWLSRVGGGAFGWGIDGNIQDAYRRLCLDYDEGDEIYLFGFSRGAYTVRSLAGMMRIAGGLLPRTETDKISAVYHIYRSEGRYSDAHRLGKDEINRREIARKTQAMRDLSAAVRPARVTVLGCWDTVGSLGVPRTLPLLSRWLNKKYEFHDCQLSNIIQHALHAVAIDETRQVFDYTPMEQSEENRLAGQTLHQVWFPGDHGAVGGGEPSTVSLADGALLWMMDTIQNTLNLGLEFKPELVERDPNAVRSPDPYRIHPQPTQATSPFEPSSPFFRLTGTAPRHIPATASLHESVFRRWQAPDLAYRPDHLPATLVAQLDEAILV
jgi:uncharacterized protein (DUF2235 family)